MKIGLIYYALLDYENVMHNPKNDAATAICHLAEQLAKSGASITIFSQSPNNQIGNLRFRQIKIEDQALKLDKTILESDFKALIFKNCPPEFAVSIKKLIPYEVNIYLWTAFGFNSPFNKELNDHQICQQFKKIVCVSDWQRMSFYENFSINKKQLSVVYYAICPVFENLFADGKELFNKKSQAPYFAYLADDNDGLDILLDSFDDIVSNYNNIKFGFFSKITNPEALQTLTSNKNVILHQSLSMADLVKALSEYTILLNPSQKNLTSNITILEAMACGLYPVISDAGANSDYSFRHGKVVPRGKLNENSLDNFLSEVLAVCQSQVHYSSEFYDVCFKQTIYVNKNHTWKNRAEDWLKIIEDDV